MYIEVQHLVVSLNKQLILHDLNLSIEKGTCLGIVGTNGSGKSVLLKAICGFVPLQEGKILVNDEEIIAGEKFIQNAGVVIEQPDFVTFLSARENLKILADIQKQIDDKKIEDTLKQVGLKEAMDKKYKEFSLGMEQRLRIAQAIMEDPDILILDEPFNGLDKIGVAEMIEVLEQKKKSGKTIFLTSHDERHIAALCDEVWEIDGGTFV